MTAKTKEGTLRIIEKLKERRSKAKKRLNKIERQLKAEIKSLKTKPDWRTVMRENGRNGGLGKGHNNEYFIRYWLDLKKLTEAAVMKINRGCSASEFKIWLKANDFLNRKLDRKVVLRLMGVLTKPTEL